MNDEVPEASRIDPNVMIGMAPVCVGYSTHNVDSPLIHQGLQRWCLGLPEHGGTRPVWMYCGDYSVELGGMKVRRVSADESPRHGHLAQALLFVQVYDVRGYPTAQFSVVDTKVSGADHATRLAPPQLPDCDGLSEGVDQWCRKQFAVRSAAADIPA